MKKIGFFGGSFDPIHFGHIDLGLEMLEKHQLDEILFCPAFCSPFKREQPPVATPEERFEMVKLAIADIPQFRVTPLEIEQKKPSYTIETLKRLPKGHYFLILTKESGASFSEWKDPEEIKKRAPLLMGERRFPISSTEIRERFKKKLYCGHLVPAKTLYYIQERGIYSSTYETN